MTEDKPKFLTKERIVSGITSAVSYAITMYSNSKRPSLFGIPLDAPMSNDYLSNTRRRDQQKHEESMKQREYDHEQKMIKLKIDLIDAEAKLAASKDEKKDSTE